MDVPFDGHYSEENEEQALPYPGEGIPGVGAPGFPVGMDDDDLPEDPGFEEILDYPAIQHKKWPESKECADLLDQYTRTEAFWETDRKKMEILYKDYVAWHDKTTYAYRSNLYIPKIYTAIRQIVARAQDAVLATPHMCVIEPLAIGEIQPNNLTVNEKRAALCTWLMEELLRAANFNKTYTMEVTLDAAIFGRCIGKLGWHTETRAQEHSEVVTAEFPAIIRVSPFRFLIDPAADRVDTARFVFEDMMMSKEAVWRYVRAGIFDEKVAKTIDYDLPPSADSQYLQKARQARNEGEYQGGESGYCIIVEAWAYLDPDGNNNPTLHRVFWDKESLKVIGVQESPFKHGKIPYVVGVPFPVPESPYGMGIAEILHYLQKEYNAFRNMAVDNALAAANNIYLLNRVSGIDVDAFTMSKPNRVVYGNFIDENNVRQFQTKSNLPDLSMFLQYLDSDIQTTSGVTPVALAQKAASTAFATQTLQMNSQVSFDVFDTCMSLSFLQPALEQMWGNVQQFLELPVLMRVAEGDPIVVDRSMIQGQFRVLAGNTRAAGRRFQQAQALTTTLAMAGQAGVPGDYGRAMQRVLDWYGVEHPEAYFPSLGVMAPGQAGMLPGGGEANLPGGIAGQPNSNEVAPEGFAGNGQGSGRVGPGGDMPMTLMGQGG